MTWKQAKTTTAWERSTSRKSPGSLAANLPTVVLPAWRRGPLQAQSLQSPGHQSLSSGRQDILQPGRPARGSHHARCSQGCPSPPQQLPHSHCPAGSKAASVLFLRSALPADRCRIPPSFSLGLKSRPTAPLHPRPPPLLTEDCLAPSTACLSVTCFERPTLAYVVAVMGWPSSSPPEPAPTEHDL